MQIPSSTPVAAAPGPQFFLGRQPILDRQQQLFAYKLLFRDTSAENGNCARIDDATQASATVIANTFAELAAQDAIGRTRCLIGVDRELLESELLEALPTQRVALDILDKRSPAGAIAARCQQLRARGFMLFADAGCDPALRAQVDVLKVDLTRTDVARLPARIADGKRSGCAVLAEKVESHAQAELCQGLGFDYFQGYYFAQPTVIVGARLTPSRAALLRLLALVAQDAETGAIENAFKQEPGLTVNMLRLTNSVSCGLSTTITSLRHAITLLGRRSLQRWLQLLVYSGRPGQAPGVNPLLQLAATRGRLMELLAARGHGGNRELAEQAFMVGIVSLMPALLGVSMPDLLGQLPVAPRVRAALVERSGVHGQLLQIVEATEQADPAALEAVLQRQTALNAKALDNCLAQALAWASRLDDARQDIDEADEAREAGAWAEGEA